MFSKNVPQNLENPFNTVLFTKKFFQQHTCFIFTKAIFCTSLHPQLSAKFKLSIG